MGYNISTINKAGGDMKKLKKILAKLPSRKKLTREKTAINRKKIASRNTAGQEEKLHPMYIHADRLIKKARKRKSGAGKQSV
jgi:hypothetical protein